MDYLKDFYPISWTAHEMFPISNQEEDDEF